MANEDKLIKLRDILSKANTKGIDVSELLSKIDVVLGNMKNKTIKIVLMGAFSDGKTTVIAGLTGRLESNMKIAIEESSDELTFYHLPALGYDFEIVDTPGLFGSKEREINGKQVRYSDITRDYISQAHIIIYVCDAVTPLKDSHRDILKYTLRDLGKLSNSIFVINKMDDAGYELADNEDFDRGANIKKSTFIKRLDEVIHLSDSERKSLKVVCMSANPNGRGLATHFNHMESYLNKSRMNILRDAVVEIASTANKESLRSAATQSSVTDLAKQAISKFDTFLRDANTKINDLEILSKDVRRELSQLREIAINNMGLLQRELSSTQEEIDIAIENASMADFGHIVRRYLGEEGERLDRTINQIFSKYAEMNNAAFQRSNIKNSFDKMGDLTKGLIQSSSKILKNTKIGADTIKGIRDVVASGYKFKPWGAVNLGKNISKALVWVGVIIDVIMWWKEAQQKREFEEAKASISQGVTKAFRNAETYLSSENDYFKNFAPAVLGIESNLKDTNDNIRSFKLLKEDVNSLRSILTEWCNENGAEGLSY